ncbi:hypothetical protein [Arthrobacter sp. C9C5]|uniref:hypothetical protein n=1 Tax=Arthrobacter sp. C9C5 TaxID=2735267 RepID=UPI0015850426|nr:hypothetical protein [Arthrobacter sp. C9C5]NUU31955.1 hypothetical protein [Arthrobacter sp. C9C5]
MAKSRKNDGSSAGFVVALIAIALVVTFWQWILLGIILWILVRILWKVHVSKDAEPYPEPKRQRPAKSEPVRIKPVPKGVLEFAAKPRPMPARELPSPDYLPRWNTTRRFYTDREHDDWQKQFDSVA